MGRKRAAGFRQHRRPAISRPSSVGRSPSYLAAVATGANVGGPTSPRASRPVFPAQRASLAGNPASTGGGGAAV